MPYTHPLRKSCNDYMCPIRIEIALGSHRFDVKLHMAIVLLVLRENKIHFKYQVLICNLAFYTIPNNISRDFIKSLTTLGILQNH